MEIIQIYNWDSDALEDMSQHRNDGRTDWLDQ